MNNLMRNRIGLSLIAFVVMTIGSSAHAEELVFTTYYPSPNSDFTNLKANKLAVGNATYRNAIDPTTVNTGTALLQGPVGIGTTTPVASLHVSGLVLLGGDANSPGNVNSIRDAETVRFRYVENYWGGTADATLIERTDDDTSAEGGIVFGFTGSDANNTPIGAPGWANPANFLPILTLQGPAGGATPPQPGGRVGIGTINPQSFVHIQTPNDQPGTILMMPGIDNTAVAGTPSLRVGIGTATPDAPLHVVPTGATQNFSIHGAYSSRSNASSAMPLKAAIVGNSTLPMGIVEGRLGTGWRNLALNRNFQSAVHGIVLNGDSSSRVYAGYFDGDVQVSGELRANNIPRIVISRTTRVRDNLGQLVTGDGESKSERIHFPDSANFSNPPSVIATPEFGIWNADEAMAFWIENVTRDYFNVHWHTPSGDTRRRGRPFVHWIAIEQ